MNLKAYDMATREAVIAAAQDRELFTLCGNGLSADYLVKSTIVQCDHQGEYVYAELCQASEALLTPPAETPTIWRGPEDGLPPVGLEVEYNHASWPASKWERRTVLFIGKKWSVTQRPDGGETTSLVSSNRFRPIRTPEQIKAEQREKDIVELLNVFPTLNGSPLAYAKAAIDAGYRKFEIVDEQP